MITLHLFDKPLIEIIFKHDGTEIVIDVANAIINSTSKTVEYVNLDWTTTKYTFDQIVVKDAHYYLYSVVKQ